MNFLCDLVKRSGYFASGSGHSCDLPTSRLPCGRCTSRAPTGATLGVGLHPGALDTAGVKQPAFLPCHVLNKLPENDSNKNIQEDMSAGIWGKRRSLASRGALTRHPASTWRGLPHSSVLVLPSRHPLEVSSVIIPVLRVKKPQHRELHFSSQALTTAGPHPSSLAMVSVTELPSH